MASKLFQSVVASSVLLLANAGIHGCGTTADVPDVQHNQGESSVAEDQGTVTDTGMAPADEGIVTTDVVMMPPDEGIPAIDASVDVTFEHDVVATMDSGDRVDVVDPVDAHIEDVLTDARSREAGWPTTKAFFCITPDVGPAFCCNNHTDPPSDCFYPEDGGECTLEIVDGGYACSSGRSGG
jgi:hypothetical protein